MDVNRCSATAGPAKAVAAGVVAVMEIRIGIIPLPST